MGLESIFNSSHWLLKRSIADRLCFSLRINTKLNPLLPFALAFCHAIRFDTDMAPVTAFYAQKLTLDTFHFYKNLVGWSSQKTRNLL